MNRIYQGRVSKVEIPNLDESTAVDWPWVPLGFSAREAAEMEKEQGRLRTLTSQKGEEGRAAKAKLAEINHRLNEPWQTALWQHHELFQDAVNYYTLALAAMAAGVEGDSPQAKALRDWVEKVRETWQKASRRAETFDGPQRRLAPLLKLSSSTETFDTAMKQMLCTSRASPILRAAALIQLLSEKGDLNKVCGERIAFLCPANPKRKKRPTSKAISSGQELKRQREVRRFHQMENDEALQAASSLNLGLFLTQPPTETLEGQDAVDELRRKFAKAVKSHLEINILKEEFEELLQKCGATLKVPPPGRKPSGLYPIAAVFKFFPKTETLAAFRRATKTLAEAKDKVIVTDALADARVDDQPHFDYFTNLAFVPSNDGERDTRAVWFEFDLAAFIEAIKAPRRYFDDTQKREIKAECLRQRIAAMESKGYDTSSTDDEDENLPGFEGDRRIDLLKGIVQQKLVWLAEAEGGMDVAAPKEYAIRERTVRCFSDIKRRWQAAAASGSATKKHLLDILAGEQAAHQDDFGSASLYGELAEPLNHPIWRDSGTQPWHAEDPLAAWLDYKELQSDLADKERAIRFTPAHPKHSPRFFVFPKKSEVQPKIPGKRSPKPGLSSRHEPGHLTFTAGIVLSTARGLAPTVMRIHYAAPRIFRDQLRSSGDNNLYEVPWLQPMMVALGLDSSPERANFANCRITLQPINKSDIQLTFPVEVSIDKIEQILGYRTKWDYRVSGKERQMNFAQFNYSASEPRTETSLRWPCDIIFAKEAGAPRKSEPVPWHEKHNKFHCLSTDLGQRDAGAFARLLVCSNNAFGKRPSRAIGTTGSKQWRAVLERSGLFRLPGEDAQVWREISSKDKEDPEDSGKPFDFRDELWGERGRPARPWEMDDTADLMRLLEAIEKDAEGEEKLTLLPDSWNKKPTELSFPEQNDKLLVAMRRFQSRMARLHRWCWFLKGDDKQQDAAWKEIAECEDVRIIAPDLKTLALKRDPRVRIELELQVRSRLGVASKLLVRIANRILPLRGRSWYWGSHPSANEKNILHHLTQSGVSLDSKEKPVWLRGQRGLSLERIEQIEELRKRFQSLNQMLRREIGAKPRPRRDESVPDPCRDLLVKLDNLKKQRVNQTAHLILAEALGLQLAPPPANKAVLRQQQDQHGVYQKILDRKGRWIGPVDFIVIEDLSRYRASQGRAPRENSRLMKWCHRAVRDKLKQLCEVFGLPVLETPAAYSSRFCSRSGVPGFRVEEVTAGFTKEGQWAWLAKKKDALGKPTIEAEKLQHLDRELAKAQGEFERDWAEQKRPGRCPKRTLLVPKSGGPVFVPVMDKVNGADLDPAIAQADINAAINLALRAVADPRLWTIHPRLRSQREGGNKSNKGKKSGQDTANSTPVARLMTREKRKFGEAGKLLVVHRSANPKTDETRQPNFFADLAGLESLAAQLEKANHEYAWLTREWFSATIEGEESAPPVLHSKSFWGCVKAAQWSRCMQINSGRLKIWHDKLAEKSLFKE